MAEAVDYPDSDFSDEEQSPLDINFNQSSAHVRKITGQLDNSKLLELYGLYKQGTEGKCDVPRPGWLDGRGRRKWDAWMVHGEMPKDEAKLKYIELVQNLDPDFSIQDGSAKENWVAVSCLLRTSQSDVDVAEMSILEAAREDCALRITELLKQNPKLKDERDDDGLSALHWAADRNAMAALSAAITAGCDIDALDSSGQSALHYAVSCGHKLATEILLNYGATPTFKDAEGNTPLDVAVDDDIKELLLKFIEM